MMIFDERKEREKRLNFFKLNWSKQKNSKRAAPVVVWGRTPYNSTKRRRREEELFHARNNKHTTTGTRERERERERACVCVVLIRIRIMPKSKTKQHKHKGNHGHKYLHKQKLRATFLATHVDVLYDEYHEPEKPGTVNRTELNEDVPGMGKFYCKVTGRHFESALALKNHTKTKRFKKLKKQIANGPKPHNQRDAEAAAGMAPPTNS
jgi:bud site selection protein 20